MHEFHVFINTYTFVIIIIIKTLFKRGKSSVEHYKVKTKTIYNCAVWESDMMDTFFIFHLDWSKDWTDIFWAIGEVIP